MTRPEKIEFLATPTTEEPDLHSGDFHNTPAFEEELRYLVESFDPDETVIISLLPPFSGKFAAPGAVDVIYEVITSETKTPRLRLLVASREVAAKLRARLSPRSRESHEFKIGRLVVEVTLGDITKYTADAIVNASNTRLELGAGVSGAIRRRAQPDLQRTLFAIARRSPIKPGEVVATRSFGLPKTSRIFHAATASGDPKVVARAIKNCLHQAEDEALQSIATPALGTGTGGLSTKVFGELLFREVRDFVSEVPEHGLERVGVVLWTVEDFDGVLRVEDS